VAPHSRKPLGLNPWNFARCPEELIRKLKEIRVQHGVSATVIVDVANLLMGKRIDLYTMESSGIILWFLDLLTEADTEANCVLVFRNYAHGYVRDNPDLVRLIRLVFAGIDDSQKRRLTCLAASARNVKNCDDVLCMVTLDNLSTRRVPGLIFSEDNMDKPEDFAKVEDVVDGNPNFLVALITYNTESRELEVFENIGGFPRMAPSIVHLQYY